MKKIIDERMQYTLFSFENKFILLVVCGSIAIFDIAIFLSKEEVLLYQENGKLYIDELAQKIRNTPNAFIRRAIKNIDVDIMQNIVN